MQCRAPVVQRGVPSTQTRGQVPPSVAGPRGGALRAGGQKKPPEEGDMPRGKRMLIVDDVISTGESLHAMEELVTRAGGIIAGRMAVLAEGDAQARHDIICLAPLPLFNPDGTVKE